MQNWGEPTTNRQGGLQSHLECDATCLVRRGFDATRTHLIARDAGISKALLYSHFRSKLRLSETGTALDHDLQEGEARPSVYFEDPSFCHKSFTERAPCVDSVRTVTGTQ
ncbi:MAG: TetR family transcriptional regulator [Afipia felis]|nr:TetR family transcriptional regulator [Afipia felis]